MADTVYTTQYKIINCNYINVRKEASINSTIICTLKGGQTVQIVDNFSKKVTEVNKSTKKSTTITWFKLKSNDNYYYISSSYLEVVKTRGERCWEKAVEMSTQMLDEGNWYYYNSSHTKKTNWEAAQKSTRGCSCSYFASWVMQECNILPIDKIVSHTSAGTGYSTIAKCATGYKNLINGDIKLLNKKIANATSVLKDGDIVIHDSSIGIYGHINGKPCVITGRDGGATCKSNNKYYNMTIYSGYEFNNKVYAYIRPTDL